MGNNFIPNVQFTQALAPVARTATASAAAWVPVANFEYLLALVDIGAITGTSVTVDVKLTQATDAAGTGSKDITGAALAQFVQASGGNKLYAIELKADQLDAANGFLFVGVTVTLAGTSPNVLSAVTFIQNEKRQEFTTNLAQGVYAVA